MISEKKTFAIFLGGTLSLGRFSGTRQIELQSMPKIAEQTWESSGKQPDYLTSYFETARYSDPLEPVGAKHTFENYLIKIP